MTTTRRGLEEAFQGISTLDEESLAKKRAASEREVANFVRQINPAIDAREQQEIAARNKVIADREEREAQRAATLTDVFARFANKFADPSFKVETEYERVTVSSQNNGNKISVIQSRDPDSMDTITFNVIENGQQRPQSSAVDVMLDLDQFYKTNKPASPKI